MFVKGKLTDLLLSNNVLAKHDLFLRTTDGRKTVKKMLLQNDPTENSYLIT